jgi:hypothetical protein
MVKVERYLYFLLITFIFIGNAKSQYALDSEFRSMFPRTEKGIEYEKIYSFDTLAKKAIFLRIKQWGGKTFNSQKGALQTEDSESGFLMYQGLIERRLTIPNGWGFGLLEPKIYSINYVIRFSINFYVKDNKFKVKINDITNQPVSAYGNWDVTTSLNYKKIINANPESIENAGDAILYEYEQNPNKKNGIRLNYTAEMWRKIHIDIITILSSIRDEIVNKNDSEFDF